MAKNFIQKGEVLTLTAPAALSSGDFVVVGEIHGFASADALNGAEVEVKTGGVWKTDIKLAGEAWTEGQVIYWDSGAVKFTTTVGSNKKIGVASKAADSADTVGYIRLNTDF